MIHTGTSMKKWRICWEFLNIDFINSNRSDGDGCPDGNFAGKFQDVRIMHPDAAEGYLFAYGLRVIRAMNAVVRLT